MTDPTAARSIGRDIGAILLALIASGLANFVLGRVGLAIAGNSANGMNIGSAFAVAMFLVTPAVAGITLGVLSPRPVILAVPLVVLSLGLTYLSLGPAGMPRGQKIFEYVIQTAIIAAVGSLVARRRMKTVHGIS